MTASDRIAALASFFSCSPEEAAKVDAATRLAHYGHRDILAHQGDLGAKLWIVLEGRAQLQIIGVDGQTKLLASHGPGELFGAFPHERVVISDVVAQNRLSVLEIPTAKMATLLEEEARIGSGLSRILGRQYNAVLDRMAARITLTANGRVYAELLREAGEKGRISPPPVIAALALSAQTTRETGSRAISALERRGIIRRDEERLEIISYGLLEELIV
ncbi:Crp/Fnr family transcriptional regulator [Parasphingorhabdus flavimaris]|uniref:Crp/Fnr family transcriptional regulator n=1 Tax=Parasphingorhabdus flavimaris TaxID=266812 RepID=A0ABX2N5T0_9SPHN|nr:Crp/Fnr family transcriptional regulator [Parasphingorhabdus flavimaris]NVD29039.1 Crp/Fnr family transcriptional regulator [Parasphingorhabdus flavimaris]